MDYQVDEEIQEITDNCCLLAV